MPRSRLQANHRWGIARHAAAALAVAALLGAAPAAEAAIIYTNPEPDVVVSPGGLGFPFPTVMDLDNNAVPDFLLSASSVFIPQIPAVFARADLVGAASGSFVVGTIENVRITHHRHRRPAPAKASERPCISSSPARRNERATSKSKSMTRT